MSLAMSLAMSAWLGLAWLGRAWLGLAWLGRAWPGLAWPDQVFVFSDVSRGHSITNYNQSRNLPGNSDFLHTLIETIVLQSRVKHGAMAMYHQTSSGKSATGASTLLAISIFKAPE